MENACDEMANFSSDKSSCGTRKRVVLSIESKLTIVDHMKAGVTQEKLATEYRSVCSTEGDIKMNEEKIRSFASTMESMAIIKKGRKVMRLAYDDKVDEAVNVGLSKRGLKTCPFSRPILCVKVTQLYESNSEPPFQAIVRNLAGAKCFTSLKQLTLDFLLHNSRK